MEKHRLSILSTLENKRAYPFTLRFFSFTYMKLQGKSEPVVQKTGPNPFRALKPVSVPVSQLCFALLYFPPHRREAEQGRVIEATSWKGG